jgi:hypothetical protein
MEDRQEKGAHTIASKEEDTSVGIKKIVYSASDNSLEKRVNKHNQNEQISTGSIRLSASALTPSATKRPKNDMWQAALEVGIAGISLIPPITPPSTSPPTTPTPPERGFFSKLTSLFTSSSAPTANSSLQSNFHKGIFIYNI